MSKFEQRASVKDSTAGSTSHLLNQKREHGVEANRNFDLQHHIVMPVRV
jgi:hypothetical protein